MWKIVILCCVCLLALPINGFVRERREVSSEHPAPPNVLEAFQKNLDEFKNCLDQSLAKTVSEVNVKQLQPALSVVGDHLNRISKAFDDLTAPPSKTSQD